MNFRGMKKAKHMSFNVMNLLNLMQFELKISMLNLMHNGLLEDCIFGEKRNLILIWCEMEKKFL